MSRKKGDLAIGMSYDVAAKKPFDAKTLVSQLSDLTNPATWQVYDASIQETVDSFYQGMIVSVSNDSNEGNNGLYRLANASDVTNPDNWEKLGAADLSGYVSNEQIDTDETLEANSDDLIPSQKAVKAYVDAHGGDGGTTIKGDWTPEIDKADDTVFTTEANLGAGVGYLDITPLGVEVIGQSPAGMAVVGTDIKAQPLSVAGEMVVEITVDEMANTTEYGVISIGVSDALDVATASAIVVCDLYMDGQKVKFSEFLSNTSSNETSLSLDADIVYVVKVAYISPSSSIISLHIGNPETEPLASWDVPFDCGTMQYGLAAFSNSSTGARITTKPSIPYITNYPQDATNNAYRVIGNNAESLGMAHGDIVMFDADLSFVVVRKDSDSLSADRAETINRKWDFKEGISSGRITFGEDGVAVKVAESNLDIGGKIDVEARLNILPLGAAKEVLVAIQSDIVLNNGEWNNGDIYSRYLNIMRDSTGNVVYLDTLQAEKNLQGGMVYQRVFGIFDAETGAEGLAFGSVNGIGAVEVLLREGGRVFLDGRKYVKTTSDDYHLNGGDMASLLIGKGVNEIAVYLKPDLAHGFNCVFKNDTTGVGTMSIVAESGVTIRSKDDKLSIEQGGRAWLDPTDMPNVYDLYGDLV